MSADLPEVIGDPAGMRALAASLRSTASIVSSIDSAVWGKVSGLSFSGPAARRLSATIGAWHTDVASAADSLQSTASLLDRAATTVEEERAARTRLLASIERESR